MVVPLAAGAWRCACRLPLLRCLESVVLSFFSVFACLVAAGLCLFAALALGLWPFGFLSAFFSIAGFCLTIGLE